MPAVIVGESKTAGMPREAFTVRVEAAGGAWKYGEHSPWCASPRFAITRKRNCDTYNQQKPRPDCFDLKRY
jgi:hypothetical protein